MGIPLAALAINQQQPGPLDQAAKALQLKGLAQQQQYQAQAQPLELQQRQQALQSETLKNKMQEQQLKDSDLFMKSLSKNNGNWDTALEDSARNGMSGEGYMQYGQMVLAHKQAASKLSTEQLSNKKASMDMIDGELQGFRKLAPEDQAAQWPQIRQRIAQADPEFSGISEKPPTSQQLDQLDAVMLGGKQTADREMKAREVAAQEMAAEARKTAAGKPQQLNEAGLAAAATSGGPNAPAAEAALKRLDQAKLAAKTPPDPEIKAMHKELLQAQIDKSHEPTADEQRRADLARNMNENLDQLEDIVNRRPELFGPVAGRMTQLKNKVGTSDPDIAKLEAVKEYLGMASVGAHSMRNAQHVETAANAVMNGFLNSPDAVKAAIGTARSSTGTFMQDEVRRKNRALGGGEAQQQPAAAPATHPFFSKFGGTVRQQP